MLLRNCPCPYNRLLAPLPATVFSTSLRPLPPRPSPAVAYLTAIIPCPNSHVSHPSARSPASPIRSHLHLSDSLTPSRAGTHTHSHSSHQHSHSHSHLRTAYCSYSFPLSTHRSSAATRAEPPEAGSWAWGKGRVLGAAAHAAAEGARGRACLQSSRARA